MIPCKDTCPWCEGMGCPSDEDLEEALPGFQYFEEQPEDAAGVEVIEEWWRPADDCAEIPPGVPVNRWSD